MDIAFQGMHRYQASWTSSVAMCARWHVYSVRTINSILLNIPLAIYRYQSQIHGRMTIQTIDFAI